jgi:hypothetical protein
LSSRRIERKVLFVDGKVLAQVAIAFSICFYCARIAFWRAVHCWKVLKAGWECKISLKA